jgi:hypothetical protein
MVAGDFVCDRRVMLGVQSCDDVVDFSSFRVSVPGYLLVSFRERTEQARLLLAPAYAYLAAWEAVRGTNGEFIPKARVWLWEWRAVYPRQVLQSLVQFA